MPLSLTKTLLSFILILCCISSSFSQLNEWTWIWGDSTNQNLIPEYGAPSHHPGTRYGSQLFVDTSGNPWVFGGHGYDESTLTTLNDLWSFDDTTKLWIWESGAKQGSYSNYGTLGVPDTANEPPKRLMATNWTDSQGRFWMFGGKPDIASSQPYNDLWMYDPSTQIWTWMHGSDTLGGSGNYGTLGIASASNVPGSREKAISWVDATGQLWMFGGQGHGSIGVGFLNDLWKFNPNTNLWTWVSGDNTTNASGNYGTMGVSGSTNMPGARSESQGWVGANGDLWLFGGIYFGNYFNDLWKFDVALGQWVWMDGNSTVNALSSYGNLGITANSNDPGARSAAVSWSDLAGDLWLFGGRSQAGRFNDGWKYTVSSGEWTWITGNDSVNKKGIYGTQGIAGNNNFPGARSFASGKGDGNGGVWLFGGLGYPAAGSDLELNDLWHFNTLSQQWTWMGGDSLSGKITGLYGKKGTTQCTPRPASRTNYGQCYDPHGNLWIFGGSVDYAQSGYFADLWKYDPNANVWTWMGGSRLGNDRPNGINSWDELGSPGLKEGVLMNYMDPGKIILFGGAQFGYNTNSLWIFDIATGEWELESGCDISMIGQCADVQGPVGIYGPTHGPWARRDAQGWVDSQGKFWMFGGIIDFDGCGQFGDLWNYDFNIHQWAYFGVDTTNYGFGTYVAKGQPHPNSWPSHLSDASTWIDDQDNLWLFGGWHCLANSYQNSVKGDLWKYNTGTNLWTWAAGNGDTLSSTPGVYGVQGIGDTLNIPAARLDQGFFLDSNGIAWLFGGYNYVAGSGGSDFSDLWSLDLTTLEWTWVAGDTVRNVSPVYGTKGQSGPTVNPGRRFRIAAWPANNNIWICGNFQLDVWKYTLDTCIFPLAPTNTTTNTRVCAGDSAFPSALGVGTIHWFDQLYGGNQVAVGPSITLPSLTQDTIFYAEDQTCGPGGPRTTIAITVDTIPTLSTVSSPDPAVVCLGDQLALIANGATTYSWSGGISNGVPFLPQNNSVYVVTGTTPGGCFTSDSVIVQVNVPPTVTVTGNHLLCFEDSSGTLSAVGNGLAQPITYSWNSGQTGPSLSNQPAGAYLVTVTDTNGCIDTTSLTLLQPTELILNPTSQATLCSYDSSGSAMVAALGGTFPYSYLWNQGDTTNSLINLGAGQYTVTVSDSNGCLDTLDFLISAPPPLVNTLTVTDVACNGDSNGTATAQVSGGVGGYAYLWSDAGATTGSQLNSAPTGWYSITVSDTHNCELLDSVFIDEPANLLLVPSSQDALCHNDSSGWAAVSVSGGTSPYAYLWSNGALTDTANNLLSGTYSLLLTDSNGCTDTTSLFIGNPPVLANTLTATTIACAGDSTGGAFAQASGGVGGYAYLWSDAGVTIGQQLNSVPTGWYSVTVSDTNNCELLDSILINSPDSLLAQAQTDVQASCYGDSNGAVSVQFSGGSPPLSITWSTQDSTTQVAGLPAGLYHVMVVDTNGCTATDTTTINEPDSLEANAQTDAQVSCFGLSDGDISVLINGGTGPFQLFWSTLDTTAQINGLPAGIYGVLLIDDNNCSVADSTVILQPDSLHITLQSTPDSLSCTGSISATTLGGTGPYTYLWDDPASQTTATASGLCQGTYCVTITDANGCDQTECTTIISTGLGENKGLSQVRIYPNPNGGTFTLELGHYSALNAPTVLVRDATGRVIFEDRPQKRNSVIQLPEVAKGVYFLEIVFKDHKEHSRIVVQ